MKAALLIAFALFTTSSFCQFSVEVQQDITSNHLKISDFRVQPSGFHQGCSSLSISYVVTKDNRYYFEPSVSYSFLADETEMSSPIHRDGYYPDTIHEDLGGNTHVYQYSTGTSAKTKLGTVGFNLYKKINRYLAVGGGAYVGFYQTTISDNIVTDGYYLNSESYVLASRSEMKVGYDKVKAVISVPILVRGYLPFNKSSLRLSLMGHLSDQPRILVGLGYEF